MKHIISIAVLSASVAAFAEEAVVSTPVGNEARPKFSVLGGRTVGHGANVLEAGIGYPGAHVGFIHGFRADLDLGGRLSFNGAYEGMAPVYVTGVKGQALLKYKLLDKGKVSLALEAAPGAFVYSGWGQTSPGITLPVGMKLGIAVSEMVGIGLAAETPLYFTFARFDVPRPGADVVYPAGLYLPILTGGGVEVAVLKNLLVTLDGRVGATIIGPTSTAVLTMQAKAGVAWSI